MKLKPNKYSALFGITLTLSSVTLYAADVNTTGITAVLNTDNAGNKYLGNGTLQISADANSLIELGTTSGAPVTEFAMTSGGLITIDSGVTFRNGGFAKGTWTNNLANLTINGVFDMWDGNPARVNALNGSGPIVLGFGGRDKELRVGLDNGSGTFSGNIATANGANVLRIFKEGTGTQTFNGNLSAQIPRQYIINGGTIELSSTSNHTMSSLFLGAGQLTKTGSGNLTIGTIGANTGALLGEGIINVTGGSLNFGSEISARANFVAAAGTTLGLNFNGAVIVNTLSLGGSGPLAAGTYGTSHPTYGTFFTGTGQLIVTNGMLPESSGTWSSTTNGYWNSSNRWVNSTIANGSGNTATINAASAVTVSLDRSETIGSLSFQNANHTLNGDANTLTMAGTAPSVNVASGITATINGSIAGTSGLVKDGAGTLNFANVNKPYTGGSIINEGKLVLSNVFTGNANFTLAAGTTLEFNATGTTNRALSGGTISGSGNIVKAGNGRIIFGTAGSRQNIALSSNSLIDVQEGVLRSDFANTSANTNGWLNNKADLNVASGAFFDIWDANPIVDAISGSGTINKGWNGTTSLTFGADNGSGTFSGTFSNAVQSYGGATLAKTMNLIKTGTGTQTFSGSNTYTGTTAINDGTLFLTGATQTTSAITFAGSGRLGLDIGSSVTAANATVDFTGRTVLVTGTPTQASYTLLTASTITGTPTLDTPAPVGYSLSVVGNQLLLVSAAPTDPFLTWTGNDSGVVFDGDANNDGVENGTAWFLGAPNKDANATELTPKVTTNAGALVLEFDCLDATARGSSVFEVQYSNDLGQLDAWAGTIVPGTVGSFSQGVVDFEVTDPAPAGGLLKVVATIPVGESANGKLFTRIKGSK